jgi:RNA polymerase sigma factor (sigma-70 family)
MSDHDRELVERARRGDGAAIGELFSRYWRAARAAAFGVIGDVASAEDAAAEAFRQAWVGIDSLRDPDRFGPWLRTIVVRTARLARLRRQPAPDVLLDDLPDSNDLPDTLLERLEMGALIQGLVRELPPRLREAVFLFYYEGYDSADAARFLEIPAGTLRRRLHEGRRRLRSAADHILKGSKPMNRDREAEIERLKRVIDNADKGDTEPFYQALRASLALRPAPSELIDRLVRTQMKNASGSDAVAGGTEITARVQESARRFAGPSDRAADPNHPVGSVAARIRRALPHFQDWTFDVGEAAAQFFTFTGEHRDRRHAVLPPGFADGRPGAFVRATRALLLPSEDGRVRTTYQLVQESQDQQTFRAGMNVARISDVLDLTWMVAGPLELRTVQELLEGLSAEVLPGTPLRFANYDEPRYRSALQLQVGGVSPPAANGGVLAEWPGRPPGVGAAHLRIFLEPWATVRSGQVVDFDRLPPMPRPGA